MCEYDLFGIDANQCPECGRILLIEELVPPEPITHVTHERLTPSTPRRVRVLMILALAGAALLLYVLLNIFFP
jgi:hypothetical protein